MYVYTDPTRRVASSGHAQNHSTRLSILIKATPKCTLFCFYETSLFVAKPVIFYPLTRKFQSYGWQVWKCSFLATLLLPPWSLLDQWNWQWTQTHVTVTWRGAAKVLDGGWMRVASINMTDTSNTCPSGLRTLTSPRRCIGCCWMVFIYRRVEQ